MPATVLARLALMAVVFAIMAPVQFVLNRVAPRSAGWGPMLFHRLFLWLFGIRVTIRGAKPRGDPGLVLANHVSWLDIAVIGSLAPLAFIAKSEVAGWPVIRTLARLQRTVFVDRGRRSSTAEVNATVAGRLAAGDTIVLFAEGTTGDGLKILPFRSALVGAVRDLARRDAAQVALHPLAIAYTRRNGLPLTWRDRPAVAWYGDMELAPHLLALLGEGPLDAVVQWCDPLPPAAAADRKGAALLAEQAVRDALAGIRGRSTASAG